MNERELKRRVKNGEKYHAILREEKFKGRYITYRGSKSQAVIPADIDFQFKMQMCREFWDEFPWAYMMTYAFNDLNDDKRGYDIAVNLIKEHYRVSILPLIVDRRRAHKFSENHPPLLLQPEYPNMHFHGILFTKRDRNDIFGTAREKEMTKIARKFESLSSHARDVDIQKIVPEYYDLKAVATYIAKKTSFTPNFLRDGSADDWMLIT